MLYRLLAVVGIGLLLVGGTAQAFTSGGVANGDLSTWGTWNGYAGGGFSASSTVDFATTWSSPNGNNSHNPQSYVPSGTPRTDANSGGEWFDIEGLYVDVTQKNGSTYLNWAVITSDAGLTPDNPCPSYSGTQWGAGEWNGELNDVVSVGTGTIAQHRDGAVNGHTYSRNPVIGLNLDGDTDRELALVLDNSNSALLNGSGQVATAWTGTTASLYKVNSEAAWLTSWYDGTDFKYQTKVDIDKSQATILKSTTNNGRKQFYDEPAAGATGGMMAGWMPQKYNFVWEGSMDITSLLGTGVVLASATSTKTVTYGLFCGNDFVTADCSKEFFTDPPTPELSTWALLGCTGLMGLFGVGRRRRRSA